MARPEKKRKVRGWPTHLLPVELRMENNWRHTAGDEVEMHVTHLWRCDKDFDKDHDKKLGLNSTP